MVKAIKLTENQESKIIEMLNELFPEHKWSWSNDLAENGLIDCDMHLDEPEFQLIHWFELCMTHLFKKIFGNEDTEQYTEGPIDVTDYECHILGMFELDPIDYLYKEFKKLN